MKHILPLIALMALCLTAHAGLSDAIKGEAAAPVKASGTKTVIDAILAKDKDSKPTTVFAVDTPKIYAFWKGTGFKDGDKLRGVWIADDVGEAAPKDTQIDEAEMTVTKADDFGAFSLSRPNKNWPPGKYHIDIYNGADLAKTLNFTIQ
ncbi:MAG: hypothetical protein ABIP97_13525 [Chthoniobacterales bacterium]